MSDIGKRIRMVRSGTSRKDFARDLGVSAKTLQRYEDGERLPSDSFVKLLVGKLGVSSKWLRDGVGQVFGPCTEKKEDRDSNVIPPPPAETQELVSALRDMVALQRENSALLRENGELHLHVERLEARNAELERQLAEALKPTETAPMGNGMSKVG